MKTILTKEKGGYLYTLEESDNGVLYAFCEGADLPKRKIALLRDSTEEEVRNHFDGEPSTDTLPTGMITFFSFDFRQRILDIGGNVPYNMCQDIEKAFEGAIYIYEANSHLTQLTKIEVTPDRQPPCGLLSLTPNMMDFPTICNLDNKCCACVNYDPRRKKWILNDSEWCARHHKWAEKHCDGDQPSAQLYIFDIENEDLAREYREWLTERNLFNTEFNASCFLQYKDILSMNVQMYWNETDLIERVTRSEKEYNEWLHSVKERKEVAEVVTEEEPV